MKVLINLSLRLFVMLVILGVLLNVSFGSEKNAGENETDSLIVKEIINVDYDIEKENPPNLVVTVTGQVPTGGYSNEQLVRVVYIIPPEDGIQDYMLLAVPPSGPAPQVITKIKAENRWENYESEAPWIKGVRVHGVDDGIMVKMFSESE